MNEQEILQILYKIDNKVDSIANELNKSITATSVLQERISNTCQDIIEIKTTIIPGAVKEAVGKSKLWVYASLATAIILPVIALIISRFL